MARLTGLFERGGSYYLRIILPLHHPLRTQYKSGKVVRSLGRCSYKEAIRLGTLRRAEVLWDGRLHAFTTDASTDIEHQTPQTAIPAAKSMFLRDVFDLWIKSSNRSEDSINGCNRALKLFEQHTKNPPLQNLNRAMGNEFRSVLQTLPSSSKTARDRFNWIKSLLKYAAQDLEIIPKSPWIGLDIKCTTSSPRQCWTEEWIQTLLSHEIWQEGHMPKNKKAGGAAAYWVPLLGIYTGARCSELCQLQVSDIDTTSSIPTIRISDDANGQRIKTAAGRRTIPVHSELIRLGFLSYVNSCKGPTLWPDLPRRKGKAGGYFSQWFSALRQAIGSPARFDFHSFRHTVRSTLTASQIPEPVIDRLLGHQSQGSIGAKTYTHVQIEQFQQAIQKLPAVNLPVKLHP